MWVSDSPSSFTVSMLGKLSEMDSGFIMLSRDILEDEMYFSERFTRMQAFIDLCFLANFKERSFYKRGIKVDIKTGQLAKSEEELAERWRWSRNTVRKFLSELQESGRIEQQKSRLITVITIKNGLVVEQQIEQQNEQQIEQLPRIKNNKDNKDNKEDVDIEVVEEKKEKEKVKKEKDEKFEECWLAYSRKGSKAKSLEYWNKLSDADKELVLPHIKAYVSSREKRYQKDFERYLRDKIFKNIVVKGNDTIYDPERLSSPDEYRPIADGVFLVWNDDRKCLLFNGYIDQLNDGYTPENRPDGAKVASGMYEWIWSGITKEWVKQ